MQWLKPLYISAPEVNTQMKLGEENEVLLL